MGLLQNIFSNREIALLIIILLVFLFALIYKSIRQPLFIFLKDVSKIIFKGNFLILIQLLFIYLIGVIYLLHKLNLWNTNFIKETIFWLVFIGFAIIFKSIQAKASGYFKKVFFESIKWTIVLEYASNLYCFSIVAEVLILLFLIFVALILSVSELDEKNASVSKLFTNILAISGFGIFGYSVYLTIDFKFNDVLSATTLNTLFLPSLLTILFIPYMYFLALYSSYELLFVRITITTDRTKKANEIKRKILWIANVRLNRVKRISKRYNKSVLYENTDLKSYVRKICKKDYEKEELS